ncbi:F-box only protein 15 isoform X1 [Saccopteryx bilineata]|uniref:F-box only protein 15 isoform X1 n=1 Tax=Saccopteryx bilineata TaxID=59482 RepID=UPI00338F53A3
MPLDSMPSEVLLKILSYLDAAALLCAGCVNRRLYQLANDNFLWVRIYATAFTPKRCYWTVGSMERTAVSLHALSVEDKDTSYWKKEYIARQVAIVKAAVARLLTPVNPCTGLRVKTKEALRLLGLSWVILLREKGGKEHVLEHADLCMNDSAVMAVWHGKDWPRLAALASLDLCGVTPIFMDRSKSPAKNGYVALCKLLVVLHLPFFIYGAGPRWHSLLAKYSLSDLTDSTAMGSDRLVQTFRLSPGLLVGLWKRTGELAFIMASLHFHQLLERSTLGSAAAPYEHPTHAPLLDDSPEYGLRGYQLHLDMHGGGDVYLCSTFRNLFTSRGDIENGYVKLMVIHSQDTTEHLPLGDVGLSWRAGVFDGCIKSCSIMDVTLLDECGKPFWCFSSPVCMRPCPSPCDGPHSVGQTYCIDYQDPSGAVRVELVWLEETEEYFVVSLELHLSVAGVNRWFGTQY